jgi:hypothetical protein
LEVLEQLGCFDAESCSQVPRRVELIPVPLFGEASEIVP